MPFDNAKLEEKIEKLSEKYAKLDQKRKKILRLIQDLEEIKDTRDGQPPIDRRTNQPFTQEDRDKIFDMKKTMADNEITET